MCIRDRSIYVQFINFQIINFKGVRFLAFELFVSVRFTDSDTVDSFYKVAIDNGGTDEGAPGPRDYAPGYYGAYCRDRDGNKLHIYTMLKS